MRIRGGFLYPIISLNQTIPMQKQFMWSPLKDQPLSYYSLLLPGFTTRIIDGIEDVPVTSTHS